MLSPWRILTAPSFRSFVDLFLLLAVGDPTTTPADEVTSLVIDETEIASIGDALGAIAPAAGASGDGTQPLGTQPLSGGAHPPATTYVAPPIESSDAPKGPLGTDLPSDEFPPDDPVDPEEEEPAPDVAPSAGSATSTVVEDELSDGSGLDPASGPLGTSATATLGFSDGTITEVSYSGVLGDANAPVEDADGFTINATDGSWSFTINKTTGEYEFELFDQLDHPKADATFGDDTLSGVFTATIVGSGGSTTGNITIVVNDDAPVIDGEGSGPSLTVDESNFTVDDDDDFQSAFSHEFGADGADGEGSGPDYALAIGGNGEEGQASGLIDSETGDAVLLFLDGSDIVGLTSGDGFEVFRVSVDEFGNVELDGQRAVIHDPDTGTNQSTTLSSDDLIQLVATVTDSDGDSASATQNIGQNLNFLDSAGLAVSDEDMVAEGIGNTTAGDVILGTDPDVDPDSQGMQQPDITGADGGLTVVGVASGDTGSDLSGDVGVGAVVSGLYGDLVLNSDGTYDYTVTGNVDGNQVDTFTYTITDADGDLSSTTLAITVKDDDTAQAGDGSGTVEEVDLPVDTVMGSVTLDFGADPVTDISSISLAAMNVTDPDNGDAIVPLTSGGQPVVTQFVEGTNTLIGFVNVDGNPDEFDGTDIPVFELTLDTDGNFIFTLNGPIDHPDDAVSDPVNGDTGAADTLELAFGYTATDGIDSANGTITITVEDDGPSISATGAGPELLVDETTLGAVDTDSFAGAFTSDAGNDGDGGTTYALSIVGGNGTDSGLDETLTGQSVLLSMDGDDIVGTIDGGATEVFRISVDGSGDVTLDQSLAVVHTDDVDENDQETLASNLVTLTATITDGDGDTASADLDIGDQITFEDDGPSISATGAGPELLVDETTLGAVDTDSFAGAFTSDAGNDGDGGTTYALSIVGGNGTDSGLDETLTGQSVLLSMDGDDIVGTIDGGATEVFRISVDGSGDVTLDQSLAVEHLPNVDENDQETLASNLVTLTATITDGDGDTASADLDIGDQITFEDDGPSISATGAGPELLVDESDFTTDATASFAGAFTSDAGNDGEDGTAYTLSIVGGNGTDSGLDETLTGQSVLLSMDGDDIVGTIDGGATEVFRISVDGSGDVTLDQSLAVEHLPNVDENDQETLASNLVTLTATITDGDGDTATADLDIGDQITFEDDGPNAIDPMPAMIVNSIGAAGSGALDFFGNLGSDGAGDVSFDGIVDGVQLMDTSDAPIQSGGLDVFLFVSLDGHTLTATTDVTNSDSNAEVFTVTLNPDNDSASLDQYTIEFFQTLDDGSTFVFDDFSMAPAGQKQWVGLDGNGVALDDAGDPDPLSNDLLITPTNVGGTINTSSTDIGNANQWIDPTEGIQLDLVLGVDKAPGKDESDTDGFTFSGHYSTSRFTLDVLQVQGAGTAAIMIAVFLDAGGNTVLGDGASVNIDASTVVVMNGLIDVTGSVTITEVDDAIVIEGMDEGWTVEFLADGEFNSVEITNADGATFDGSPFAVGGFEFSTAAEGEQIDMSFDLEVTDGDGDTSSGTIDIAAIPEGDTVDASGATEGTALIGSSGEDNLLGSDFGDLLDGGAGADSLSGGNGLDAFVYNSGSNVGTDVDQILDFTAGETFIFEDLGVTDLGDVAIVNNGGNDAVQINGSDTVADLGVAFGTFSVDSVDVEGTTATVTLV